MIECCRQEDLSIYSAKDVLSLIKGVKEVVVDSRGVSVGISMAKSKAGRYAGVHRLAPTTDQVTTNSA